MKTAAWRAAAGCAGLALALLPGFSAAASCSVSVTPIAFGVYDPQLATPTDSSGSVTVACQGQLLPQLLGYSISASSGSAGSYPARRMNAGAAQLKYQLHVNALRTAVWGDGGAGSTVLSGSVLISAVPVTMQHAFYGRIAARQTGTVSGLYSDTVTVTVEY